MIVFINGPFGVGKTTVANALVEQLPNAMVFDPEEIGTFLRRLLGPFADAENYQDLALWRTLTVEVAGRVYREFCRDLIVPMSIFRRDYFDEIITGLRIIDAELTSFQLVASYETLLQRIISSADTGGREWRLNHLDTIGFESADPSFGHPIVTDDRTPHEIARLISRLI